MRALPLGALLVMLLAACAKTPPPAPTAEYYLQQGESYFDKGLYSDAIAAWEKVRDTYYSPELNILAEAKIAEAHFLAEEYVEAAAAYENFLKQHPDHESTPRILYQLGMSYYRQMLTVDRDQTATRNALVTFESLLKRFPDSPRQTEAAELVNRCRQHLAEHEVYVGDYYLRTGHYPAAIGRLSAVPDQYPDYAGRDKVYYSLARAYQQNGDREQALAALNRLREEFPASEYEEQARELLEELN